MTGDDQWMREIIRTVEAMSRQLVEFRQDISRSTLPLYPRIVEGEKRFDREAAERAKRQRELDAKLAAQDAVLAKQGADIQQAIGALNAQGETLQEQNVTLKRITGWQRARLLVEILVLVAVVVIGWYLSH